MLNSQEESDELVFSFSWQPLSGDLVHYKSGVLQIGVFSLLN